MTPAETKAESLGRMRAEDLDGALETIADDAVYFWSNGSAMIGKAAIAEALAENFALIDDDPDDIADVGWLADTPEVAACVFRFQWTGTVDRTGVGPGTGRHGAAAYRRRPAGGARAPEPGGVAGAGPTGVQAVRPRRSRNSAVATMAR